MTLADIVRRFDATLSGSEYVARCPAHEDNKASLNITQQDNKILIHCHAGCTPEDIVRKKNLKMSDLFISSNGHRRPIVAAYEYKDDKGILKYQNVRYHPKDFRVRRPHKNGGWVWTLKGVKRLPYRLPDIKEYEHVYITEGEKDADRLWSEGVPATCSAGGARSWTATISKSLAEVGILSATVLPDCDPAGAEYARTAHECNEAVGISTKVAQLPGENGFDVSDYLDRYSLADLLALPEVVPEVQPSTADVDVQESKSKPEPIVTHPRTLAQVHAVFVQYLGADYDLAALDAVLAAAAAERLDGDPLWLLIISGPGNAKTETVQALSGVGAITVSTIASEGALLSASPKREQSKDSTGGLLRQLGARGILVVKDLTSILSMQSNTRAPMLSALREIHDGKWVRRVGTDGGKTLVWNGRVVIIGACTTAWDTHHSAIATMGDRFVLLRMNSRLGRDSAGRHAIRNTGIEKTMRAELAEACAGLLQTVEPQHALTFNDEDPEIDMLLAAANITALCRTGVEYDYRGDPIEAHMPEMPTRFAKQLTQVIRGGVAIGMSRAEALQLAIRCARDSMPPLRLAILQDLWAHPGSQIGEVGARLSMPWSTVKRGLESLYLLQVLTCDEVLDIQEMHVEVEDTAEDKTEASKPKSKTKRTMKKRTIKKYRVVDDLRASALGLEEASEATEDPPF